MIPRGVNLPGVWYPGESFIRGNDTPASQSPWGMTPLGINLPGVRWIGSIRNSFSSLSGSPSYKSMTTISMAGFKTFVLFNLLVWAMFLRSLPRSRMLLPNLARYSWSPNLLMWLGSSQHLFSEELGRGPYSRMILAPVQILMIGSAV